MKSEKFCKWLEEEILPKLQSPGIIVDKSGNQQENQYSHTVSWLSQHTMKFRIVCYETCIDPCDCDFFYYTDHYLFLIKIIKHVSNATV